MEKNRWYINQQIIVPKVKHQNTILGSPFSLLSSSSSNYVDAAFAKITKHAAEE